MCVSVYFSKKKISSFVLPIWAYLHIVFSFQCLCFRKGGMGYGSNLDLKLARSLRGIGLENSLSLSLSLSLAGLLLIVNFHSRLPTRGLEHKNCMRQKMVQIQIGCRIATKAYENIF